MFVNINEFVIKGSFMRFLFKCDTLVLKVKSTIYYILLTNLPT